MDQSTRRTGTPPQRLSRAERRAQAAQSSACAFMDWAGQHGYVVRYDLRSSGRLRGLERSEYMSVGEQPADEETVRRRAEAIEAILTAAYARRHAEHKQSARQLRRRNPHAPVWPWQVSHAQDMTTAAAQEPAARAVPRAARARGAGRPAARRTSSTRSSTSSGDSSEPAGEPPPAPTRLALAPPLRAVLTFGCPSGGKCGARVEAVTSLSRRAEVSACAAKLDSQLEAEHCAICPLPRGLPAQVRADVIDLLSAAVAELRKTRPHVGQRLGREGAEPVFVVWEAERPPFFDEDGER